MKSIVSLVARFLKRFSMRDRAGALYKRGMAHAKLHEEDAAIADYTAVIGMQGTPVALRSMAIFNRALVYCARRRDIEAVNDLRQLLGMEGAAGSVRTEARRMLVRIERSSGRLEDSAANGSP